MQDFSSEITFRTARSGGKGGQNVNKVETMAEALWLPVASQYFTEEEKERIIRKLAKRINKDGFLHVRSSASRSQLENKELAVNKMLELVATALIVPKKRKKTKPSKAAVERRLQTKKKESEKKESRKSIRDL